MVRSLKLITFVVMAAVLLAVPASAATYDIYDDIISPTYIEIFRDISSNIKITDSYVFFRSGENEYIMAVGDIEYDGNVFIMASGLLYSVSMHVDEQNNSQCDYSVMNTTGFILKPENSLVYSNLGDYPDLNERSDLYEFAQVYLLLIGLCIVLIRPLFDFSLRKKH